MQYHGYGYVIPLLCKNPFVKFVGCLAIEITVVIDLGSMVYLATYTNMTDKISRHEKTKTHVTAASIYGQWKSGNTMGKDAEVISKNNISFRSKVLQRLSSVILTLCSLNLAFRGHRETSYNGVCEGGNFLAIVSLMAQCDDVLGEVISLPSRVVKYLNHPI